MVGKHKDQVMVLGDEAVSFGAVDAGVKGVYAYPGTPSTEVFEGAQRIIDGLGDGRVAKWAANEKVSYELALGTSYTGHRSMVVMNHVGLNVAMDAFVNSAITGVQGGLVVVVADDPGMHSSQNEQDTRALCDFACIPCLEPSTPQQAYEYTIKAFDLSEKLKLPIVVRLVTRLAHARAPINRSKMQTVTCMGIPGSDHWKNWVLIPAIARVQYQKLRDKTETIKSSVESYNQLKLTSSKIGIVTSGMGSAYFDQICREFTSVCELSRLNISAYPISKEALCGMVTACEKIYVFEENYPYIEDQLIALSSDKAEINGRRNGVIPIAGELNPLKLKKALGLTLPESIKKVDFDVTPRPPKLCDGCGHIDAFKVLKEAYLALGISDYRIFGDIGCYTLGTMPPHLGIHTCVEMGASAGMTLGAALAELTPSVGVIGDSTFMHSALPTIISFANSKVNATLVVMDNRITGMTGQQPTVAVDLIPNIAKACGFSDESIHQLIPLAKNNEQNLETMIKVLKHDGPDLVIFKRECIQALRKGLYKEIDKGGKS